MIRLPPRVMPGIAAALALLVAGEWMMPAPGAAPAATIPAIPAAVADNAVDEAVGQWGDTSLARPLFNPDRRPVSAPGANTGTSLPRLSAIIVTSGIRAAIFSADGQKPQVVQTGGIIDGYQLTHIAPGSIELAGPAGTLTLRPQFIATSSSPPAAATVAAPGAMPGTIPANNSSNFSDENPN